MKKILAVSIASLMLLCGCSSSEQPTVSSIVSESITQTTEVSETTVTEITIDIGGAEPLMPPTESSDPIEMNYGVIDEDLIGAWFHDVDTVVFSYVFYDDGTGSIIVEDTETNYYDDAGAFNYSVNGDMLILDMAPDNEAIDALSTYTYVINGDTLTLTDSSDCVTILNR